MERFPLDEATLSAKCGHIEQIAHVRPFEYSEGTAAGLRMLEVKCGALRFSVMPDKCLDIAELSYRGMNLSFLSKVGVQSARAAAGMWADPGRGHMGGLLFTSGLENICPACEVDGVAYPEHGSIRFAPAAHVSHRAEWIDGKYTITVSGEVRQARMFGENLILRRSLSAVLGEPRVVLRDEVQNLGFRPEPVSILYHCNLGYPLLDEGARLILPSLEARPRDACASEEARNWARMGAPEPCKPEAVFLHRLEADDRGRTLACVVNDDLTLGLCVRYGRDALPRFVQWKSEASGDYAMGLEPTNASVYGRAEQIRTEGGLHMLDPMAREGFELCFEVVDGPQAIRAIEAENAALLARGVPG